MIKLWKKLIYVRGFHLVWFNVLVKETFGLYFTAQARRYGDKQSGTGQEADIVSRFY